MINTQYRAFANTEWNVFRSQNYERIIEAMEENLAGLQAVRPPFLTWTDKRRMWRLCRRPSSKRCFHSYTSDEQRSLRNSTPSVHETSSFPPATKNNSSTSVRQSRSNRASPHPSST